MESPSVTSLRVWFEWRGGGLITRRLCGLQLANSRWALGLFKEARPGQREVPGTRSTSDHHRNSFMSRR